MSKHIHNSTRGKDRNGAWHLSQKGYPRYHTGQYRNRYVHRVRMEQHLGRRLRKDEDVHHRNGIRTDFRLRNLTVIDHKTHGWVSSKQRYFMQQIKEKYDRQEWEQWFG